MNSQKVRFEEDVEIVFNRGRDRYGNIVIGTETTKNTLANFLKSFVDLKEKSLYTRFLFFDFKLSTFNQEDWTTFISGFGYGMKSLKLMIERPINLKDDDCGQYVMELAKKLNNLLVNQLPNLKEFGLCLNLGEIENSGVGTGTGKIPLFPKTTSTSNGNGNIVATRATTRTAPVLVRLGLPHLKVLYFCSSLFSNLKGIVRDFIEAAVNLEKIELFDFCPYGDVANYGNGSPEIFHLLQSLGKLGCVQNATVSANRQFVKPLHFPQLEFKLQTLKLYLDEVKFEKDAKVGPEIAIFLSHLFESSKDTLRELNIHPWSFLQQLTLPKFSKLEKLQFRLLNDPEGENGILPPGFNMSETFPVVQHLKLGVKWTNFLPHGKRMRPVPNLKSLHIITSGISKEDILRISQIFTGLKELAICKDLNCDESIQDFPELGTEIWTHMEKLQSLYLDIDPYTSANAFPALDSSFTGFSGQICSRLFDVMEAETLGNLNSNLDSKSIKRGAKMEAQRKNPSILHLKDLRELKIGLFRSRWNDEETDMNSALAKKSLAVSEKCAFEHMDNLKYTVQKK